MPELGGNGPEVGTGCAAVEGPSETARSVCAKLQKGIHRQGDGIEGGGIRHRLGKPELMCDAIHLPDAVPAIGSAAQIEAGEMGKRQYRFGVAVLMLDRREHHRLRLKARTPDWWRPVMRRVGIAREIATPSDLRTLQGHGRTVLRLVRWSGTPDDNRHSGADIPKRNRRPKCASHACMPPANASRC